MNDGERYDGLPLREVEDALLAARPGHDAFELRQVVHASLHKVFGAPAPSFGRYEEVQAIGRGAQGLVYRAYDPDLRRHIALKVFPRAHGDTSIGLRLSEARALARVQHPNVLTVHEVGEHNGHPFIATEYCSQGDLRRWLGAELRGPDAVISLFAQVASALAAAHTAGLVHGDIKPDNILIDAQGSPRVGDFGGSRELDSQELVRLRKTFDLELSITLEDGVVVGTPAYMAPEQLERGLADTRSDQYSFFVSLHEALYGARPGRPHLRTPKLSRRLRRLLRRGLGPRPTRLEDMGAVHAALQERSATWGLVLGGGVALSAAALAVFGLSQQPTHPSCASAAASRSMQAILRAGGGPTQHAGLRQHLDRLQNEEALLCTGSGELPLNLSQARTRCLSTIHSTTERVFERARGPAGRGVSIAAAVNGLVDPRGCAEITTEQASDQAAAADGVRQEELATLLTRVETLSADVRLDPLGGALDSLIAETGAVARLSNAKLTARHELGIAAGLTGSGLLREAEGNYEQAWESGLASRELSTAGRAALGLAQAQIHIHGNASLGRQWLQSGIAVLPEGIEDQVRAQFLLTRVDLANLKYDIPGHRTALSEFAQFVEAKLDPDDPRVFDVHLARARQHMLRDDRQRGLEELNRAVVRLAELDVEERMYAVPVWLGRASILLSRNDAAAALDDIDRGLKVLSKHRARRSIQGVIALRLRVTATASLRPDVEQIEQMEQDLEEGLSLAAEVYGTEGFELAALHAAGSRIAQAKGDYAALAKHGLGQAVAYESAFGIADYGSLDGLADWATGKILLGEFDEAIRNLRSTEARLDQVDPEHKYARYFLMHPAVPALEASGQPDLAQELAIRLQAELGLQHPNLAGPRINLWVGIARRHLAANRRSSARTALGHAQRIADEADQDAARLHSPLIRLDLVRALEAKLAGDSAARQVHELSARRRGGSKVFKDEALPGAAKRLLASVAELTPTNFVFVALGQAPPTER